MKCIIAGPNAKILAKAIHSFFRIGTDLFIEAQQNGLSIRTVNKTKSAFALISFQPDFFISYDINKQTDNEFENKCKVSIKSCLSVFKNMNQVEQCKITLDALNFKLEVQFKCRLETVKTHYISVLEQESLQAVYTTDNVINRLTANHKLLNEIISNFQSNEEEITLDAKQNDITAKNYVDGSHVDKRFMRTQLTLKRDEFDSYTVTEETSVTFSLRELRALLYFAEALQLEMSISFETAGQPLVVVLRDLVTFEANLVMSTLTPDSAYDCATPSNNVNDNSNCTEIQISTSDSMPSPAAFSFKRNLPSDNLPERSDIIRHKSNHLPNIPSIETNSNVTGNTDIVLSINNNQTKSTRTPESAEVCVEFCEESDGATGDQADVDFIPPSPTSVLKQKKLARIFRRCFESTFDPMTLPGATEMLAENSESEEL